MRAAARLSVRVGTAARLELQEVLPRFPRPERLPQLSPGPGRLVQLSGAVPAWPDGAAPADAGRAPTMYVAISSICAKIFVYSDVYVMNMKMKLFRS